MAADTRRSNLQTDAARRHSLHRKVRLHTYLDWPDLTAARTLLRLISFLAFFAAAFRTYDCAATYLFALIKVLRLYRAINA